MHFGPHSYIFLSYIEFGVCDCYRIIESLIDHFRSDSAFIKFVPRYGDSGNLFIVTPNPLPDLGC